MAGPPCRIAGAGFPPAEDREALAGPPKELDERAHHLLVALVVRAGAADPEEVVDVVDRQAVLAEDGDVELPGPVAPRRAGEAPGVAARLEVLEQPPGVGLETVLGHHQVAAHVDDLRHVLDEDRAGLHAGAAGRAVPEDRVGDRVADHPPTRGPLGGRGGVGAR